MSANVEHLKRLFLDALMSPDFGSRHDAAFQFVELISRGMQSGGNGTGVKELVASPAGQASRSTSSLAERVVRPSPTYGHVSVRESAPGSEMGPPVDVWAKEAGAPMMPGTVVQLTQARIAEKANVATGEVPVGVVAERSGHWARVRMHGPAFVKMDDMPQTTETPDVWLSERGVGVASFRMPTSARRGIVLIGHKTGGLRTDQMQILVRPAIYPAYWQRVWEYDSDNYIDLEHIALRGGFWRMVFVVGGETQLILDETRLYIARGFREQTYGSETTQSANYSRNGEVEWNPTNSSISIGVPRPSDGAYVRVAEVLPSQSRSDQVSLLVGLWRTTGAQPYEPGTCADFSGARYAWNSGQTRLDLSLDGLRSYMAFARVNIEGIANARMEVNAVRHGSLT